MSKILLILWFLGAWLLGMYILGNNGIPLWYDHGAYKHFVNILEKTGNIQSIPYYLQQQFEPFSGVLFYTLTRYIGQEVVFSYGYPLLYLLISISFFLLGKKNGKYTFGSYIWLLFFLISVGQYMNLWWAFWKQMFAILFLILLIRYNKKTIIGLILLAWCIALHRLTGFVAIMYIVFDIIFNHKRQSKIILYALALGLITYIPTIQIQVLPYLHNIANQSHIFLTWKYGTGFSKPIFWTYITPLLIAALISMKWAFQARALKEWVPLMLSIVIIFFIITFRGIGHTRFQSFWDLFLIIFISQLWYRYINVKILTIITVLQISMWSYFTHRWHTPYIEKEELDIIKNITSSMPKNINIVTLTWAYMSMMTGYVDNEIYSTYQGIWSTVFDKNELKEMRWNKSVLCKNLELIDGNTFIYVGAKEVFTSTIDNPCLHEIKNWHNNARLLVYKGVSK